MLIVASTVYRMPVQTCVVVMLHVCVMTPPTWSQMPARAPALSARTAAKAPPKTKDQTITALRVLWLESTRPDIVRPPRSILRRTRGGLGPVGMLRDHLGPILKYVAARLSVPIRTCSHLGEHAIQQRCLLLSTVRYENRDFVARTACKRDGARQDSSDLGHGFYGARTRVRARLHAEEARRRWALLIITLSANGNYHEHFIYRRLGCKIVLPEPTGRPRHEGHPARRHIRCLGSHRHHPHPLDDGRFVFRDHHLGRNHPDAGRAVSPRPPVRNGPHLQRRGRGSRREHYADTSGRRGNRARPNNHLRDVTAGGESSDDHDLHTPQVQPGARERTVGWHGQRLGHWRAVELQHPSTPVLGRNHRYDRGHLEEPSRVVATDERP